PGVVPRRWLPMAAADRRADGAGDRERHVLRTPAPRDAGRGLRPAEGAGLAAPERGLREAHHKSSDRRYALKAGPRSSRARLNSTVAFRKPSLSPGSYRSPTN